MGKKYYQTIPIGEDVLRNENGEFMWMPNGGEMFSVKFRKENIDRIFEGNIKGDERFQYCVNTGEYINFIGISRYNNEGSLCRFSVKNKKQVIPLPIDFRVEGFINVEKGLKEGHPMIYGEYVRNSNLKMVKSLYDSDFYNFDKYKTIQGIEKTDEGFYLFKESVVPVNGLSTILLKDESKMDLISEALKDGSGLKVLTRSNGTIRDVIEEYTIQRSNNGPSGMLVDKTREAKMRRGCGPAP